jgi:hypothetical protein
MEELWPRSGRLTNKRQARLYHGRYAEEQFGDSFKTKSQRRGSERPSKSPESAASGSSTTLFCGDGFRASDIPTYRHWSNAAVRVPQECGRRDEGDRQVTEGRSSFVLATKLLTSHVGHNCSGTQRRFEDVWPASTVRGETSVAYFERCRHSDPAAETAVLGIAVATTRNRREVFTRPTCPTYRSTRDSVRRSVSAATVFAR